MKRILLYISFFFMICHVPDASAQNQWSTDYVYFGKGGKLCYTADELGNVIPDFSHVGYRFGDENIPDVPVVLEVSPLDGDDGASIQAAIEAMYNIEPDASGFRGAVLLKKGEYQIEGQLKIEKSGIVLRGEGKHENGTILWATGTNQRSLLVVGNNTSLQIDKNTGVDVIENYVPVGRQYLLVENASAYKAGDLIAIYRPGTNAWISAIKMNQLSEGSAGDPTQQWTAAAYDLYFERQLTRVHGDTLFFRNPVVMALDKNFGGGQVFRASFDRLENIGIENMVFKSEHTSETDEAHAWTAVEMNEVQNGWARNLQSWYFAYASVSLKRDAKMISVIDCASYEPKSIVSGGRRYSFYCEGQLNLFKGCEATEGRHDYISGSKVCGPNVFTQSKARNAHNDIGPHHRWAMGILFDQIDTDNEINVQDRDDMGSGHGWAGANMVFWNCKGSGSVCQSPWASAKNYNFGFIGRKLNGYRSNRPDGVWLGNNRPGLFPASLYETQLDQRLNGSTVFSAYSALEQLNDSVFLMQFNLPLDLATVVEGNFQIGGTAGIEDHEYSVELYNEYTVKLIFPALGLLPSLSVISINANNVLSESGLSINGLNSSDFLVPDERPVVEGAELSTNNEAGSFAAAKSSKEGFIYLILMGEPVDAVDDFEQAVNNARAAKAEVSRVGVSVPIYTRGLRGGVYRYYAIDTDGRISAPSNHVVIINETGPVTSVKHKEMLEMNWFVQNGQLNIQPANDNENYHMAVYDTSGKKIIQYRNLRGRFQAWLPHPTSGPFILRIIATGGVLTDQFIY
ncbi:hypothetical protein [Roseimarinus sediminis]|uniref:hypothetical protein n=1 Tax=Roseimarinus sediminis TaxID=1610899 RepID=UPI003D1D61CD